MQREKPPEWREKQKGSRGIRRGQRYRLVFQFPIRELPITCHTCFAVWQDAYKFKDSDFDIKSGNFTDTGLTDITIGQISEPEEESVNILYADQYETLPIERYMTNEEVGRLVFNFMKRTNGEALLIVFPEYDNGDDNDDKNTRCVK